MKEKIKTRMAPFLAFFVLLLQGTISQAQCNPNFTVSNSSCPTIDFTDLSISTSGVIVQWTWDLGDGTIVVKASSDPSADISHTYTANGTYNVCLTITTSSFCSQIICQTVNVDCVCPDTTSSFSIAECTSYTVPSGHETYTVPGTHTVMDTIPSHCGGDSIMTINLSIGGIINSTPPVLADVTGECTATATTATTTDSCGGTITGTTTDTLTYSTQGTHVITWSFDDGNGNVITVPQNVVINDTTDPVMPTLADITGDCTATATAPTTTDNCSGTITGTTTDTLTYSTQGTHVITWSFDDGNGNVITVPQNVVINDTTDPVMPTLADITGDCTATATAPTTTDNCSGTITGTTTDTLTYSTQGTHVITWSFDDGNGNVITVPQNVVINDTTDPVMPTLADITGDCTATATAPTTTDNCSGTITGTTTDTLTYSAQGTHVITWSFDDGNGNVITVPQNVVINDTTDPVMPTLADITGDCTATATAPTTTDNCSGTITGTTTDTLTYSTQGTHVITWSFDDGNGNVITVPQNVVINDTTDPVMPTLADITGDCTATATAPTTTDNCSGTITGTTTDTLTYSTQGTHVITWSFDDGNGNVITVPQNVVINDTTDPVIPTLADITGDCTATATTPTTTDNCSGTITGTTTDTLTYSTQGTHVITWSFDDGNGNVITVPQNVVINDTTAPVSDSVSLVDIVATCEVTTLMPPTATDNCAGIVTVVYDVTMPITVDTVVTWTFDDGNGNVSMQTQNVIITGIDVSTSMDSNNVTIVANNMNSGVTYQWIDCSDNSPISGATLQSYTPSAGGDYAVIITEGNCSDTSACVNSTVGLNSLSMEALSLYPNPSKGIFHINFDGIIHDIEIVDIMGHQVEVETQNQFSMVDARNLAAGTYIIRIRTDKELITKVFVIRD